MGGTVPVVDAVAVRVTCGTRRCQPGRSERMEALPTPAEYVVALTTATKTGRRTPYTDTLLDGLHLALIVHGPIVVLTLPSETP